MSTNVSMSTIIKNIMIAVFFLVLTVCVWQLTNFIESEVHETMIYSKLMVNEIHKDVISQINVLRNDTFHYLENTNRMIDNRMKSIETQTLKRVDVAIDLTNTRTEQALNLIDTRTIELLQQTDKVVSEIAVTNRDLRQQVHKFDQQLDCENNDFCWQNLATDTMVSTRNVAVDTNKMVISLEKNVQKISEDIGIVTNSLSKEIPVFVENSSQIAQNINRITKPRWYDRLIGYGVSGSLVMFNFSRAGILPK